ncbi:MAG TPA: DUF1801 domain-containing protein [Planctomycetes bacterium]|nr:DUF1801 domain-containing protein [Planctomycetota bacterium]
MSNRPSFAEFLERAPAERHPALRQLRSLFRKHLPKGFEEELHGNAWSWVVPHRIYPAGYHCDPSSPLPFLSIASQKNFIAIYHMGLYADPAALEWFQREWAEHVPTKLDMGKSCIRLKRVEAIPYSLLGELAERFSVRDWVALYEASLKR